MKFGLTDSQIEILHNIFSNYNEINEVVIYGSRAKGNYNERSDIDLIIKNSDASRKLINKILLDFDDSNLPYIIELQNFTSIINEELIEHINRVGQVLYKKSN